MKQPSVYLKMRVLGAIEHWKQALAEHADFAPTLLALAELWLEQG